MFVFGGWPDADRVRVVLDLANTQHFDAIMIRTSNVGESSEKNYQLYSKTAVFIGLNAVFGVYRLSAFHRSIPYKIRLC